MITNQRTIAGGSVVSGAPKTKSGARTIALDATTVDHLRLLHKAQSEQRLAMGAGWPKHDLVFTHADGTGLWPQTVTARFRALCDELALPAIGIHGLRHTAATFLIASGVNPRVVQQRLGHANVGITLGIYSHVLPGHDRDAVDSFASAVDSARSRDRSVIRQAKKRL